MQITGKLQSIVGTAEAGKIVLQLQGYGSQIPRLAGTTMLARTTVQGITVGADGVFNVTVPGNDVITPVGTYYTVLVQTSNGDAIQINAYRFAGTDTVDLSSAVPFDPSGPVAPIVTDLSAVPFNAGAPVFDGSVTRTFDVILTGDVTAPIFRNGVAGNLYIFVVQQDGVGGHTFTWPAGVNGGGMIDPDPNSVTTQAFVARSDGTLYPLNPPLYWP